MSCHSPVSEWTTISRTDLPQLRTPQATVLAWWRVGMVRARSWALTAVATCLAVWRRRQEPSVRQQGREWVVYINRAGKELGLLQVGLTIIMDPAQPLFNRSFAASLDAAWPV